MALAPGWMLWAVDGGVSGGDVDPTQLDYFTRIGADLSPDVRVILTWPTPAWATGHRHGEAQVALDRFVIDTLGDPRRVALYLSGDSHHYAHLIDEQHGIHYVTAGGGGALPTPPTRCSDAAITTPLPGPPSLPEQMAQPGSTLQPVRCTSTESHPARPPLP